MADETGRACVCACVFFRYVRPPRNPEIEKDLRLAAPVGETVGRHFDGGGGCELSSSLVGESRRNSIKKSSSSWWQRNSTGDGECGTFLASIAHLGTLECSLESVELRLDHSGRYRQHPRLADMTCNFVRCGTSTLLVCATGV